MDRHDFAMAGGLYLSFMGFIGIVACTFGGDWFHATLCMPFMAIGVALCWWVPVDHLWFDGMRRPWDVERRDTLDDEGK